MIPRQQPGSYSTNCGRTKNVSTVFYIASSAIVHLHIDSRAEVLTVRSAFIMNPKAMGIWILLPDETNIVATGAWALLFRATGL